MSEQVNNSLRSLFLSGIFLFTVAQDAASASICYGTSANGRVSDAVAHDEHYHVDFTLPCRPMTDYGK